MNKIVDKMFRGSVRKTIRDIETGEIVSIQEDRNLIVNLGRYQILKMLNGEGGGFSLTRCSVGTGGATIGDPFTPIPPVATDTALAAEVLKKDIGTSYYNGVAEPYSSLTFATAFLSSEVDAMVNEVGLWLSNDELFARHTFPTMYLMADKGYSMEVDWTFEFDAA